MARQSKAAKLQDLHKAALEGFRASADITREEREASRQDRRFAVVAGAQWEDALGQQYANKPKFEVNKVGQALLSLKGKYRENRITVDFVPKTGGDADELADTLDGLYRADENDSGGQDAYLVAFDEMATGGYGSWRLRSDYEDPDDPENEQQRIYFEPIYDADKNVYWSAGAKKADKTDADECWVLNPIDRRKYEREYKDDPAQWPKELNDYNHDWITPDVVVLCEYYRKVDEKEIYQVWATPTGEEIEIEADDLEEVVDDETGTTKLEQLEATGHRLLREKVKRCKKIEKYILSGGKVLSGPHEIPGKYIPIIPAYAIRAVVDGIERWKGLVRDAKDAQRLKNMQISELALQAATGQKSKPIFGPSQMANPKIQQMWAQDGVENYAYLLAEPLKDAAGNIVTTGPMSYTQPAQVTPAMGALLQMTDGDLSSVLGDATNAEEIKSNVSADAVELVQSKLDTRSTIYMDSFAQAVKHCGQVWLSMAKEIYVEEGREMKTVPLDGGVSTVKLKQLMQGQDGGTYYANDLSHVKMDVVVDVGPMSSTRRNATVRALTGMAQVAAGDPATQQVLVSAALMNMDGEGLSDLRAYFRKGLVRQGVVKPSDEEAQEMAQEAQSAQPDAQTQYLMAEAQKAQAMTVKASAETEKIQAQTAEILAGISMQEREQVLKLAQMIQQSQSQPQQQTQSNLPMQ